MALNDLELSLMAFPQRWVPAGGGASGGTLQLNVLLLPVGDPTQPLGSGPAFAGTAVPVVASLSAPGALPSPGTGVTLASQFVLTPPPVAPVLFTQLASQFATAGITLTSGKLGTVSGARIKKSLPASYTNAIPFEGPASDDVLVGDGYGCALRAQAPGLNQPPPGTDRQIAWGQVLSYALRQPALARALGLIYPVSIAVPDATLAAGGFVYVTLDVGSPWAGLQANPDAVRAYAARLPALAAADRALFAAALVPVVPSPDSNLTQAQLEAAEYDDGFAQVVHGNQPATIDAATLQPDRIAPGSDAGIQVGWDDEQVTAWLNGQLDLLRVRVDPVTYPPASTPEAPLGVQGYRVDVRVAGSAQQAWASLCAVKGTLPFNDTGYGSGAMTSIDGELWVAPAPVRPSLGGAPAGGGAAPNDGNGEHAWLPLYFAQWAGASLVLPDPAVQLLAAGLGPAPVTPPAAGSSGPRPDLSGVPALRYGTDYEFRVRLVDLTGGGPGVSAAPVHPGPVPATLAKFRRYVTPKALLVDTHENLPPYPAVPPAVRDIHTLTVRRPRIGYPEALFAGVNPATFAPASLAALINAAKNNGGTLDIADPDVGSFDVIVEARIPARDTGPAGTDPGDADGNFRVVYSVNVPFGAGADPSVTLTLDYTDGIDDISTVEPPAAGATTLPVPTARDIRVRLQPRCADKLDYYGTDSPPTGPYSDYIVRQAAATEDALFAGSAASQLSALYFQPGSNIPQLLGQQLGVAQNGLTLTGQPGQRTVFGASGALRHTVTADGGSITFSNQTELLGHWIVAITLPLERDWTWDGFAQPAAAQPGQALTSAVPSLAVSRDGSPIGAITVPRAIAASTLADPSVAADRSGTRIIFFDAIDPNPAPGAFPAELSPGYTVTTAFEAAAAQTLPLQVTLPITTPPAQTPKIVATGLAESPYAAASDYSSTSPRDRFLWIEFDQPIADPEDCYFGRVLAYGPDPLLALSLAPTPDPDGMLPPSPEPALPVDPEPVRVIFPGQASDSAGLGAMSQLIPAVANSGGTQGTFFMLPLPPGVTAQDAQLFGFWTYEFRVGHAKLWSTAQGRFGRPLRVSGIQHPAPSLICSVNRTEQGIAVSAPYATAVLNGRRVFNPASDPQTQIWFMLYAQALQADGASSRNILLGHAAGVPLGQGATLVGAPAGAGGGGSGPRAYREFPQKEVIAWLNLLGLTQTSSLSVLAVELLPFGQVQSRKTAGPPAAAEPGAAEPADDAAAEPAGDAAADAVVISSDPLGADLGSRRILRTSPLTALPAIC
jgi:hypothetical protein